MTPKQAVAKWVRLLRLQEWDIFVEVRDGFDLGGEDGTANVARLQCDPMNRFATVIVCAGREASIEADVRHELVHLALMDFNVAARRALDGLGKEAAEVLLDLLDSEHEHAALRIDRALEAVQVP